MIKRLSVILTVFLAACSPTKRLDGETVSKPSASKAQSKAELADWRNAQRTNTPAAYRGFIGKHPASRHVATATQRMKTAVKKETVRTRSMASRSSGGGGGRSSNGQSGY